MPSVSAFASTIASQALYTGETAWTNPSNAGADDASHATVTLGSFGITQLLLCSNFGLSVPAGARIDAVQIEVQGQAASGSTPFYVQTAALAWDGDVTGLNRATDDTATWSTTTRTVTYGSSTTNDFGVPLTASAVNDSKFGCAIQWGRQGSSSIQLQVDYIKIVVHYTESAGREYDTTEDVAITACSAFPVAQGSNFKVKLPGFGTPKACMVFCGGEVVEWDTAARTAPVKANPQPGSRLSIGAAASAAQWSVVTRYRDAVATPAAIRVIDDTFIAARVSHSGDSLLNKMSFVSFGADYIELKHDVRGVATEQVAMLVVAFGGSSLSVAAGHIDGADGTTSATLNPTSLGFDPKTLLTASTMEVANGVLTHTNYAGLGMGFAAINDATITQRGASWEALATSNRNIQRVSNDRLHHHHNPQEVETYTASATDFGTGEFTVTFGGDNGADDGGDDGLGWLALSANASVFSVDSPTATGAKSWGDSEITPDIGGKPKAAIVVGTIAPAENTIYDQSDSANVFGVSAFSEMAQCSVSLYNNDGAATTDAETRMQAGAVWTHDNNGSNAFTGKFTQFENDGFSGTFSAADSTARKWVGIAFGVEAPAASTITYPDGVSVQVGVGSPTLNPGAVSIAASGVSLEIGIGSPTVAVGSFAQNAEATGISVGVGIGAPTLNPGAVALLPDGVSIAVGIGSPTVVALVEGVAQPTGVSVEVGIGSPTLVPGAVNVAAAGVSIEVGIGAPSLKSFADLLPSGISVPIGIGSPTLTQGAASLLPGGVSVPVGIGSPSLSLQQQFASPDGISIQVGIGSPVLGGGSIWTTISPVSTVWTEI
jgi:hypothetical protein